MVAQILVSAVSRSVMTQKQNPALIKRRWVLCLSTDLDLDKVQIEIKAGMKIKGR
jgi:hypothetical protein